jgi:hypothetical protein
MKSLKLLFDAERKRVFEPDASFTQRVMDRVDERPAGATGRYIQELGIWDAIPGSTRPVLAFALMLLLCFVGVELFVPQLPQSGMVESFLAPEQSAAESFLYNDTDMPSRQDVLQQLIDAEEQ